jgi:hypothetical protein
VAKTGEFEMKRNYKYEKEILHWLDGGEIEVRYRDEPWEPVEGAFYCYGDWQYRIVEPELCEDEGCDHHGTVHVCVSPKEERWLYVYLSDSKQIYLGYPLRPEMNANFSNVVGKIRMEDV